jgi:20S proteasome alpha/beta subunit
MASLRSYLHSFAVALALGGIAIAREAGNERPVLTGTVNIVLGNAHGIVALTDSRQTSMSDLNHQFPPAQKLFRLDDQTICTIAGFGSVTLPQFPDFFSSAAGIIDRYAAELRNKPGPHSFREKLTSLAFLAEFYLNGIENLQTLSPAQVPGYGFEFTLAGYDVDGTPKIAKAIVSTQIINGSYDTTHSLSPETAVGHELTHETAGIGSFVAENILEHPQQLADEKEIGKYAATWVTDRGSSLTTSEMQALASSLAHHAAIVDRIAMLNNAFNPHFIELVGGKDQVAVLEKGGIEEVEQQTFPPRPLNMTNFNISSGFDFHGEAMIKPASGAIMLYVNDRFVEGTFTLDQGYFYGDKFEKATLTYDGGVSGFEHNEIVDCGLIIGPHADRRSAFVRDLVASHPWKRVQ